MVLELSGYLLVILLVAMQLSMVLITRQMKIQTALLEIEVHFLMKIQEISLSWTTTTPFIWFHRNSIIRLLPKLLLPITLLFLYHLKVHGKKEPPVLISWVIRIQAGFTLSQVIVHQPLLTTQQVQETMVLQVFVKLLMAQRSQ